MIGAGAASFLVLATGGLRGDAGVFFFFLVDFADLAGFITSLTRAAYVVRWRPWPLRIAIADRGEDFLVISQQRAHSFRIAARDA